MLNKSRLETHGYSCPSYYFNTRYHCVASTLSSVSVKELNLGTLNTCQAETVPI